MVKIAILGADGAMGRMISNFALGDADIELVGAFTEPGGITVGIDIATLIGKGAIGTAIQDATDLEEKIKACSPDVVIDFTVAKATEANAPVIVQNGIKMVIGTTALSPEFMTYFTTQVSEYNAPSIVSSNYAIGMNVFMKIAEDVAKVLQGWDTEIIEAHHNRKKDAPSGTAMSIATSIATTWGRSLDEIATYGRQKGLAPRTPGTAELGIHAIRAGDIVGDHTVMFAGSGERIELVHRAHDRSCFASGAIKAARFLGTSENLEPRLYTMREVLGI